MFEILIEKRASRDIRNLSKTNKEKILKKVFTILKENPYPNGKNPKKLSNSKYFRLRIGNFRVLYEIKNKTIMILAIKHRKNIYK